MAALPDLALIDVLPLVDDLAQPGLRMAANNQLTIAGFQSLDLVVGFRLAALPGGNSFTGHVLELTGVEFGGDGGVAYISQELVDRKGADVTSALTLADNETDYFLLGDGSNFSPVLSLAVTTNVFLTGLASSDTINLSAFTQRYFQTGPTAFPGDFDIDGSVDGNDFLVWQRGGSPTPLSAMDLADWQTNFGQSLPTGQPSANLAPEPTCLVLSIGIVAGALMRLTYSTRCVNRMGGNSPLRNSPSSFDCQIRPVVASNAVSQKPPQQ
jgi:hypothetical protein